MEFFLFLCFLDTILLTYCSTITRVAFSPTVKGAESRNEVTERPAEYKYLLVERRVALPCPALPSAW
jgi:hypothetical protein